MCKFEISNFFFNHILEGFFFFTFFLEFLSLKCYFPHFIEISNVCFQILQVFKKNYVSMLYIFCHVQEQECTCKSSPCHICFKSFTIFYNFFSHFKP
jgi:hypothetical protein